MISFYQFITENKKEKFIFILRGIPGAGKSHLVKEILSNYKISNYDKHVFSSDDYWCKDQEDKSKKSYIDRWNKEELPNAHAWCFNRFLEALEKDVSPLIIDNTNVKREYFLPYIERANGKNYNVRFMEPKSPWWRAFRHVFRTKKPEDVEKVAQFFAGSNEHGVPVGSIKDMINNWEEV